MTNLKLFVTAATLAGGLGFVSGAGATPLSPAFLGSMDGTQVERVAGGCGPGFHPNPWGVCRPNFYGPRPFYGRPVYGGPGPYFRPRPVYRPYGFYGPRPFY